MSEKHAWQRGVAAVPKGKARATRRCRQRPTRIYESSYRRIGECSNTVLRLPVAQKPNSKDETGSLVLIPYARARARVRATTNTR